MKFLKIKKIGLVIFSCLLIFTITLIPNFQARNKIFENEKDKFTFHLPIKIEGNDEFTKKNGVICGNGTIEDPYIIANWKIYPIIKNGIHINNTDKYFIIENCQIYKNKRSSILLDPGVGIYLNNVINGKIRNVRVYNLKSSFGILIASSSNIYVDKCVCFENRVGISVNGCSKGYAGQSNNNTIKNCTFSNCEVGIYFCCLPSSYNNLIESCKINENFDGICLDHCVHYTTIVGCNISNNKKTGLEIKSASSNNHISNNSFWDNTKHAIDNCTNNWDNGLSFGGNFWGEHNCSNPYEIPGKGNNIDNFPLIKEPTGNTLIALFLYSPKILTTKKEIFFDGSLSFEESKNIIKYEWDFDDGVNKTGKKISHKYENSGKYNVTLKISNQTKNDTIIREIEILNLESGEIFVKNGQSIQQAIKNAKPGYDIIVENGTYFENIIINKPYLNIIGNDYNETIIDGQKKENVVFLTAPMVNISGFTIKNSSAKKAGIQIGIPDYCLDSIGCNIKNNTIIENYIGINMSETEQNEISNNLIKENIIGIHGIRSYSNTIKNNKILSNNKGIFTEYGSNWNKLYKNKFSDNSIGLYLSFSHFNIIKNNNIENNNIGIKLTNVISPEIHYNNIYNNSCCGIFFKGPFGNGKAINNWWGSRCGPSFILPIFGDKIIGIKENGKLLILCKISKRKSYIPWSKDVIEI